MLFTKILINCDSCDTISWVLQSSYDTEQKRIHLRCSISVGHSCCHCKEAGASHLCTAKLLNVEPTSSCCWSGGCFHPLTEHQSQNICWLQFHQTCFQMTQCRKNCAILTGEHQAWKGSSQKLENYWNNSGLVSWWCWEVNDGAKIQPDMFLQQIPLFQYTVPISLYLEDAESSTYHHTPISQSPSRTTNINNRVFSIAIGK